MDKFRNITYPYQNDDDVFVARGYHLNQIVDEINNLHSGTPVDVGASGSEDVILGRSKDIDSAFIDYSYIFPGEPGIGGNYDQTGSISVNNSSQHTTSSQLSWQRESISHTGGTEQLVTIEFVIVGADLVMRITNTTGYAMKFAFTPKLVSHGVY